MKITIFTSDQPRHNYLINKISEISDEIFVIQEKKNIITDSQNSSKLSNIKSNYFSLVNEAQEKLFGDHNMIKNKTKINLIKIQMGQLSLLKINEMINFFESDYYLIFGSSYIKGDILKYLSDKSAINIHMGISPYYRGSGCNFWALYDNNPSLVGATIHYLDEGLDSGPIIYHAISERVNDDFLYSMSTVKSAILSIVKNIKDKKIDQFIPMIQDKKKQIRYSRYTDFNDKTIREYMKMKKKVESNFDLTNLKDYYLLKKDNFFIQ